MNTGGNETLPSFASALRTPHFRGLERATPGSYALVSPHRPSTLSYSFEQVHTVAIITVMEDTTKGVSESMMTSSSTPLRKNMEDWWGFGDFILKFYMQHKFLS